MISQCLHGPLLELKLTHTQLQNLQYGIKTTDDSNLATQLSSRLAEGAGMYSLEAKQAQLLEWSEHMSSYVKGRKPQQASLYALKIASLLESHADQKNLEEKVMSQILQNFYFIVECCCVFPS